MKSAATDRYKDPFIAAPSLPCGGVPINRIRQRLPDGGPGAPPGIDRGLENGVWSSVLNQRIWGFLALATIAVLPAADSNMGRSGRDWPVYGGNSASTRYSPLKQINRSNVAHLTVAWTYDTADGPGASQTQPIVVEGVLYGLTPKHKVIAVEGATGKELWRFDPGTAGRGPNRGLVYWSGARTGGSSRLSTVSCTH